MPANKSIYWSCEGINNCNVFLRRDCIRLRNMNQVNPLCGPEPISWCSVESYLRWTRLCCIVSANNVSTTHWEIEIYQRNIQLLRRTGREGRGINMNLMFGNLIWNFVKICIMIWQLKISVKYKFYWFYYICCSSNDLNFQVYKNWAKIC